MVNHNFEISGSHIEYGPELVPDTGYQLGPKGFRLSNLVHKDPDCPIGINGDQNGTR